MEPLRELEADCVFRRGGHSVRLALSPAALDVEVEAHLTADRWRGRFDASFIEDLTHRTGNFKQFDIFCAMVEAALSKSSPSVTLDLLTYSDLETLRSRKVGASARPAAASPLSTKRYLILVYSVEFDRIHYPLPLQYAGRPDPAALGAALRELREELQRLRTRCRCGADDERTDCTVQRLREELQQAQEEKQAALRALRQDAGTAGSVPALQRALGRLEEQLKLERTRHQREQQRLSQELSQTKASQQRLQQRVTALTAELGACRRGRAPQPSERPSRSRDGSRGSRPPTRFPSPAGPRPPRFDPTAFVRARQRQQQEVELQKQRRRGAQGSTSPTRSRGRSSSVESCRSRRSGLSSSSEAEGNPQHPPSRGRRTTRSRRPLSSSSCNSPSGGSQRAASRKRSGKENHREEPLAEIDARLRALQTFMDSLGS